jgi:hypothetical protein
VRIDAQPVAARALLHQEGVIAAIAVIGLVVRDGSVLDGLAPHHGWAGAVAAGTAVGGILAGVLWLARRAAAVRELERWQQRLVEGWDSIDAAAVALLSGVAEEALMRALLQPLIGLVPAAVLFAVLHVVPDRRLWLWPVLAFGMGLAFGLLQLEFGFPAAAAAHVVLNGISLTRLRRRQPATIAE